MPGPGSRPPRGAGPKPKNIKKTLLRVMSYLTKSWLPLLFVLLCLLISVGSNLGGTYYMRPVINNLTTGVYSGPGDLLLALVPLVGIYLVGVVATYCQSAAMVRLAQRDHG